MIEQLLAENEGKTIEFKETARSLGGIMKTVVAFANSAPVGFPCVLFLGVRDNGDVESASESHDSVQKSFNKVMQKAYPRIPYQIKVVAVGDARVLAVIVLGSELRPHFAGPSYIRNGSETLEASEAQLAELVATRRSKPREILSFKGRPVSVLNRSLLANGCTRESVWQTPTVVVDCNEFWVTLQSNKNIPQSFVLSRVDLSFDHQENRLRLEILMTTH